MYVLVEVFEQLPARVVHARADALVHLLLQLAERDIDRLGRAALLVDGKDTPLEVHAGLNGSQHLVGGAKETTEEAELLAKQLEHATIGLVPLIQEVDDYNVVLLPVPVTSTDALLDALWVPGK